MDGADQTTYSFKALPPPTRTPAQNWIPQRQWKGTSATTLMLASRRQRHRGSSQKPPFSGVIAGQNTASVWRVTGRNRTLWLSGVKLNHPLCFISSPKINSPSSIAQKGSISKPCPLQLEPGPFVSGQGVRRLCPSARRPDSGQTGPSCRCTQQISGLNGRVGTSASAVWTAAVCFLCQGFFCNSSVAIILAAAVPIKPIASIWGNWRRMDGQGVRRGRGWQEGCQPRLANP